MDANRLKRQYRARLLLDLLASSLRRDLGGDKWTDVQFGANFSKRTKDRTADEALRLLHDTRRIPDHSAGV